MLVSSLFSIETNQGFEAVEEDLSTEFAVALDSFGVGSVHSFKKIDKMNRYSDLYVVKSAKGQFVLRVFGVSQADTVEQQCRIVSELRGVETLRPCRCYHGSYVYCFANHVRAAMLYPFISGPVFLSPTVSVRDVGQSALSFLIALRQWQKQNDDVSLNVPKIVRSSEAWPDLDSRIENIDDQYLSNESRRLIEQNRPFLRSLIRRAYEYQGEDAALSHCDLQHANLIVGPLGPAIIDLEDICLDDVAASAAHAIFKIARHSVYLRVLNLAQVKSEVIEPLIKYANKNKLFFGGGEAILAMAAHRTVGDIHNILVSMENPETLWMSYDLEKKINNLFEIGMLFDMPINV